MSVCPPTPSPLLHLQDWRAWLPGDEVADARIDCSEQPSASSIPAMLRRRLTPLGRAICDMLRILSAEDATMPIVHASRHGDGHRPLDMLDTIAAGEGISPARFSLSVHNAIIGVHSIASGQPVAMAAIAAAGDEFAALLREARGYLADGLPGVIVVLSDSPLPSRYRADDIAPEVPAAVAVKLSAQRGVAFSEQPLETAPESADITVPEVIRWLCGHQPVLLTRRPPRRWQLAISA